MIRNVLIDLDDTILDFKKCEATALAESFVQLGVEPTDELIKRYSEINEMMWKRLERKEVTREEVLTGRFAILFEEKGMDVDQNEIRTIYENLLSKQAFKKPGADELLERLKDEYDLYLVSNGTASVQHGRIDEANIERFFKKMFISQEVGYNKPDKRFFDIAFSQIGDINLDETVIIGDSLSSDIQGGINARIHTVWFNDMDYEPSDLIKPEITIKTLESVDEVIKNL